MKNENLQNQGEHALTQRELRLTSKSNNTPLPPRLGISDNSVIEPEGINFKDRSSYTSNISRFTLHSNLSQF